MNDYKSFMIPSSIRLEGVDGPIYNEVTFTGVEVGECCGVTHDYVAGTVTRLYRNADDTVRTVTEKME